VTGEEARRRDVRAFGVSLVLLADGLFFFAAFYILGYIRLHLPGWPDAGPRVSALWPGLAAASLLAAAAAHRTLRSPAWPLAGALAGLLFAAATLLEAARRGLEGRYHVAVHAFTVLWAAHVAVAAVLVAAALVRRRACRETPGAGRFLWFLAAAGAAIVAMVFLG
jgi:hypothetical protein